MSDRAHVGFAGIEKLLTDNQPKATADLAKYFTSYAGRWFEHFSALSEPDRLNANDMIACSALSVEFDGRTMDRLMAREAEINALLTQCPRREVPLWELQVDGADYRALSDLYTLLRGIDGMGPVRTSKLLACKRPHAVPIRDSVVEALLGPTTEWWRPWRDVVDNEHLRALVAAVTPPEVPDGTSILRRLDVILWMHGKRVAEQVEL